MGRSRGSNTEESNRGSGAHGGPSIPPPALGSSERLCLCYSRESLHQLKSVSGYPATSFFLSLLSELGVPPSRPIRSHLRAESYICGLSRVALLASLCPCGAVLKGGQGKWHLHDTWLGALAAGLKIVRYEFALNLPGHVGEAAGRRGVRTNCGERDRMSPGHHPEGKATSCHNLRG